MTGMIISAVVTQVSPGIFHFCAVQQPFADGVTLCQAQCVRIGTQENVASGLGEGGQMWSVCCWNKMTDPTLSTL